MSNTPESVWDGLAPKRLRALVKGASSTVAVAPSRGARTHQTYPWWLEALLESAGLPSEVRNAGVEGQRITRALCDWEREVQQWAPDVVILNYGQYECMPGMIPQWLERHATGWHRHSGPVRDRYRQSVISPLWRKLAVYQQKLARSMLTGPFRTSPERTIAELARLVEMIQSTGSPLVIVMDTWPIAPRWQHWFPGMQERSVSLRSEMVSWIDDVDDPGIRLFKLSEIVGAHEIDDAVPDGVHFSADLHREIAENLARVVLPWASQQPHLKRPGLVGDYFGPAPSQPYG